MANVQGIIKSIRDIMWQDTGLNGDAQRIEQLGWMLFFKIFSDKDKELELVQDDYTSPMPAGLHWDEWASNDEGITGDELLAFIDQKLFPELRNLSVGTNKRALILREVFEGNNNYMKSGGNIRKVLNKLNEIDFNVSNDRHVFGDIYEGILKELQSAGKNGEFYTPKAITQFVVEILNPKLGEKVFDPACSTGGFLVSTVEYLKPKIETIEQLSILDDNIFGWEKRNLSFMLATINLNLRDIDVPNIAYKSGLEEPLSTFTEKNRMDVIMHAAFYGGLVVNNYENNFPVNYRTKDSADLFTILIIHLLKEGGRAGVAVTNAALTGEGVKQRVRQRLLEECNLHTIVRLPNSVFQPYATVATNLLFFDKGTPTKEVWYYEHRLPEGQKSYSKTKTIQAREFDPIKAWWNNRQESDQSWKVPIKTIIERNYDLDIKNPTSKIEEEVLTSSEIMERLTASFGRSFELLNLLKTTNG
jgi:type I restriction enzyme M protein